MGKLGYLAMKTDQISSDLINSDLLELGMAAKNLADHAFMLGSGLHYSPNVSVVWEKCSCLSSCFELFFICVMQMSLLYADGQDGIEDGLVRSFLLLRQSVDNHVMRQGCELCKMNDKVYVFPSLEVPIISSVSSFEDM
ncbi:uncharacterized protein LOC110030520 [Phalaenopsis equestris]|uniref:uncharacterized protein LOC110030520 n=1 Tax=Phalaenopsis equestris TaxID=78828 RepID=UPI0009E5DF0A|nr:uncharacterized protein LOC110030520 [Phalaenopsis equestris]